MIIEFINFNALYLPCMRLICRIASKNMHCVKSGEISLEHLMLLINAALPNGPRTDS